MGAMVMFAGVGFVGSIGATPQRPLLFIVLNLPLGKFMPTVHLLRLGKKRPHD